MFSINNFTTNNSTQYIYICIIILERVIRSTKFIRCFKLFYLNQTIKRYKRIYSQKQQRDLINEEIYKMKLIKKNNEIISPIKYNIEMILIVSK